MVWQPNQLAFNEGNTITYTHESKLHDGATKNDMKSKQILKLDLLIFPNGTNTQAPNCYNGHGNDTIH